jgi:hypothetical protein
MAFPNRFFAVSLLSLAGCHCGPTKAKPPVSAPTTASLVMTVPRAKVPIKIDGELEDEAWPASARTEPFEDAQGLRVPHANLSFTADDESLYIVVYVADQDLRSEGDQVTLTVGSLKLLLTPKKQTVPEGVTVGTDVDGTIDDPSDDDEEWISEIAIPWRLLGSKRVTVRALRVDAGKTQTRPHAYAWPRTTPAIVDFTGGGVASPSN